MQYLQRFGNVESRKVDKVAETENQIENGRRQIKNNSMVKANQQAGGLICLKRNEQDCRVGSLSDKWLEVL